jgi:hypothetical protein
VRREVEPNVLAFLSLCVSQFFNAMQQPTIFDPSRFFTQKMITGDDKEEGKGTVA